MQKIENCVLPSDYTYNKYIHRWETYCETHNGYAHYLSYELNHSEKQIYELQKNCATYKARIKNLEDRLKVAIAELEKIEDTRKIGHTEPDSYTRLGCVMNIAHEALKKIR